MVENKDRTKVRDADAQVQSDRSNQEWVGARQLGEASVDDASEVMVYGVIDVCVSVVVFSICSI